ncbi:MAG: protein kinase [bacterium]
MPEPQKDEFIGTELGGCRIVGKTGSGGMGSVYRAHHVGLDKPVCIKILAPALASNERYVQFFLREARSAARLEHPNIVQIYHVGNERGFHFITMSYIEGKNLADMVAKRGPLPAEEATGIIIGVLSGLSAAHAKSIIHRDIKPSNILIAEDGTPKIVDFGLARSITEEKQLTVAGEMVGTAYFMAPEQGLGQEVDSRADLYASGTTYFYMLTGKYPFEGKTSMEVIHKHISDPVPSMLIIRPDVPLWAVQVVERLMRKKPEDRFQSAAEAVNALSAREILQTSSRSKEQVLDLPEVTARLQNLKIRGTPAEQPEHETQNSDRIGTPMGNRPPQKLSVGTVSIPQSSELLSEKNTPAQKTGSSLSSKPSIFELIRKKTLGIRHAFDAGDVSGNRRILPTVMLPRTVLHFSLTLAAGFLFLLAGALPFEASGNPDFPARLLLPASANQAQFLALSACGLGLALWAMFIRPCGFSPGYFLLAAASAGFFYSATAVRLSAAPDVLGRSWSAVFSAAGGLFSKSNFLPCFCFLMPVSLRLLSAGEKGTWGKWAGVILAAVALVCVWIFAADPSAEGPSSLLLFGAGVFAAFTGLFMAFKRKDDCSILTGPGIFLAVSAALIYIFSVSPSVEPLTQRKILADADRAQAASLELTRRQQKIPEYDTDGTPIPWHPDPLLVKETEPRPRKLLRKQAWIQALTAPPAEAVRNAADNGTLFIFAILMLFLINLNFLDALAEKMETEAE